MVSRNFEWVPAHCGIAGNEHVDYLAKKAALKENIDIAVPRCRKELVNHMIYFYKQIWQMQWDSNTTGRFFYSLQPIIQPKSQINLSNRRDEKIIHRLRLGKCNLNFYKFRLNRHESGLCDYCKVHETIEHFLLHCKEYKEQRKQFFTCLRGKKT